MDSLVYVADLETYELLFVNRYGRNIWGDIAGKTCYRALQQGQDNPCSFCTNNLLLDREGKAAGVHVWEFQNTIDQEWYECRDQAIPWIDGKLVRMEIATNITERKKAAAALLDEKELLSVTLHSIGDGVITTDTEGKVVLANRVAEELTGWKQNEAVGHSVEEVYCIIDKTTGKPCKNPIRKVIEDGKIAGPTTDTILTAKDGTERFVADSGAPIRDQENKVFGTVLVFRDISEELKKEEELLKARKLESLGVLAGGIAHDFNNILLAILGNLSLAEQFVDQDHKSYELIKDAEKASLRAKDLTQQLLTFSKGGEPIKKAASLDKLIRASADFALSGSNVACEYHFPDELWKAEIDPGQISQVIQNLIINANQAMPNGGKIKVSCRNIGEDDGTLPPILKKGKYAKIEIKDQGIGIPPSVLENIFDPYYTTKQDGSGLGLAVCHSIVSKHGGHISVESEVDKGATFTLYLPAIEVQPKELDQTHHQPAKGSGKVMIMDDEEIVRKVAKQMLIHLGYDVVLALDGVEAIKSYKKLLNSSAPVDVVIMDLTIPGGMGGEEAVREILALNSAAIVVVSSGYSDNPVMANYQEHGFSAAIAKPFTLTNLSDTMSSILS